MKIINSKLFQVIYYYYYLLQHKINGEVAGFMALGMIGGIIIWPFILGIFSIISALLYNDWVGYILAFLLIFYIGYYLDKNVYKTGLYKKIIKKKPKILNSNILSILFVILVTAFCWYSLFALGNISKEINKMGIHLIK